MATDAKAAAQAEARWGALAGCDPAVYLNLGTGLSAAIVAGGQVLHGSNGAAGEIGYNLRALDDVGVPLAARTLLEDMISGQALARRAASHTAHGQPMEAGEVFEASRDDAGSRPPRDRLRRRARLPRGEPRDLPSTRCGSRSAAAWSGPGTACGPAWQHALSAGVPFPPELVVARFPSDAPLIGAVALAVDAAQAGRLPAGTDGGDPVTLPPIIAQ